MPYQSKLKNNFIYNKGLNVADTKYDSIYPSAHSLGIESPSSQIS